jgi:hypothetical protein
LVSMVTSPAIYCDETGSNYGPIVS